mmetsp:Transcript_17604/g.57072  ORF Transcript_17604/g.57072 Transcript_17604/m.57072 type:complete len:90 (+) Transcript_17604:780-1049(+)
MRRVEFGLNPGPGILPCSHILRPYPHLRNKVVSGCPGCTGGLLGCKNPGACKQLCKHTRMAQPGRLSLLQVIGPTPPLSLAHESELLVA